MLPGAGSFTMKIALSDAAVYLNGSISQRLAMNNRKDLYMIIGVLIVIVIGFGVYTYREDTKPAGVEIKIGEGGVVVEEY